MSTEYEPFLLPSPAYDRGVSVGHWGRPEIAEKVADGIIVVSTASHGGYILDRVRYAEMHPTLRRASFTGDQCFEEDCSWCAVCLMWPEYFSESANDIAVMTWGNVYASKYGPLSSIFPDRF